jgi:hypothetical protein
MNEGLALAPIEVLVDTPNCACARDYEELIFRHAASPLTVPIRERTAPPPLGSLRRENLPFPIVHDAEALRSDLSIPSRTLWRPCESARPSKSLGRSTCHP